MTELNLIPEHLKKSKARFIEIRFRSIIVACILIVLFFIFFIPGSLISKLQKQENELNSKVGIDKSEKSNVAFMNDDINNLQNYIDEVEKIKMNRQIISDKIYTVQKYVPEDLKILNLLYNNEELTLRGFTVNYNSISDFVLRLESVKYFRNTRIISINYNQLDNSYEFQIKIIFTER